MTRVYQTCAAAFFTPVRGVIAILTLVVMVALVSEETAASWQPGNCCSCSGCFNPWPTPFYPPYTPPAPVVPPSVSVASGHAAVTLTKVGSPIWKPTDFQLFTAPADTGAAFNHTIDQLLPLEGPGAPVPYTPHAGPYDQELSTNAAAAGFVDQSVFPKSAITLNPNGVYFTYMLLPDPGVTGSSRDFASGPVIPNSIFPMTNHADMFLNGALVETLQDNPLNVRAGDLPFTGASHRAPVQAVWYPWANDPNAGPLGSHEIRWSLRDNQNHGWNMVAAFEVVPEPCSLAIAMAGVIGILAVGRRQGGLR